MKHPEARTVRPTRAKCESFMFFGREVMFAVGWRSGLLGSGNETSIHAHGFRAVDADGPLAIVVEKVDRFVGVAEGLHDGAGGADWKPQRIGALGLFRVGIRRQRGAAVIEIELGDGTSVIGKIPERDFRAVGEAVARRIARTTP